MIDRVASLVGVMVLVSSVGCSQSSGDGEISGGNGQPITVLTYNLYLGSTLTPLVNVPSREAIPPVAGEIWANAQKSDFPSRAKIIANQIVTLQPDLVSLQEVSLYRRQVPGDALAGQNTPNATEVVLDFLSVLMTELDARGGGYRVISEATNADAELPTQDADGSVFDLRLTDRDVMLARTDVVAADPVMITFDAKLTFPVGGVNGVPLEFKRSASRVTVTVGAVTFTFGDAHLEVSDVPAVQVLQAEAMATAFLKVSGPVLLAGDFNSQPGTTSYKLLTTAFDDVYNQLDMPPPAPTCCQADDLKNPTSTADQRIDLVLFRGPFSANALRVVGSDPNTDRTAAGQWASDHFGVLATVQLSTN